MTSVIADASRDEGSLSPSTVRDYVDALEKMYVIENQYAWDPAIRSRVRIRRSPKIHFTDPSLAAAALNVGEEMLYRDPNTTGFLFESLCYRDLCVYSSSLYGKVYHYRDNSGLEVDSIMQLRDGRWGAVEVKMGVNEFDKAAENLLRLKAKMAGTGVPEPSFLMILNAVGGVAHRRADGVTEVPLDCLGP
jgi:predicted AAA+ superfamily ATPase